MQKRNFRKFYVSCILLFLNKNMGKFIDVCTLYSRYLEISAGNTKDFYLIRQLLGTKFTNISFRAIATLSKLWVSARCLYSTDSIKNELKNNNMKLINWLLFVALQ